MIETLDNAFVTRPAGSFDRIQAFLLRVQALVHRIEATIDAGKLPANLPQFGCKKILDDLAGFFHNAPSECGS